MQQLQRCGNNDQSHWGFGTNAFMLDASLTAANHPLHLSGHAGPHELAIQQWQCPLLALVSSIVGTSIHGSYLVRPWGPWITNLFPVCQQGCDNGEGVPSRVLTSSALGEQFYHLQYLCHLPAGVWDPALFSQRLTHSQSWVLGPPVEWSPSQSHVGLHVQLEPES